MSVLNIVISVSCQNDFLEPLDEGLLTPNKDALNMTYEGCQLMWTDFYGEKGNHPYTTQNEKFIDYLENNMLAIPGVKNAPYEKIIEKYGHRTHLDAKETQRFWKNESFEKFIENYSIAAHKKVGNDVNESSFLLHLRDWHDSSQFGNSQEIEHFGVHCIKGSHGADFIKPIRKTIDQYPEINTVVNSNSLSSFMDTDLDFILNTFQKNQNCTKSEINIGIVGVVTNVKVFLLVYELMILHEYKNVFICEDFVAAFNQKSHIKGIYEMKGIFGANVVTHKEFEKIFAK